MVVLIDGDHLFSRNYHMLKDYRGISGEPAGGIYGFIRSLRHICNQLVPYFMVICWGDKRDSLWRRQTHLAYKAHRPPAPEDFIKQVYLLQELLAATGISQTLCPTFEADDAIAAICHDCVEGGRRVGIVTGDHDLFQLVSNQPPKVFVYLPVKGGYEKIDEVAVTKKIGVPPNLLPTFMALRGEKGDGVPGVKGIGKIRARDYLLGKASEATKAKIHKARETVEYNLHLVDLTDIKSDHLTPSSLPVMPRQYSELAVIAALKKAGLTGSKSALQDIRAAVTLYKEIHAKGAVSMDELLGE